MVADVCEEALSVMSGKGTVLAIEDGKRAKG